MTIPNCDPANTITQVELDKLKAQGAIQKIKFIYTEEGSYLIFVLKSDPERDMYLVTRRDRAHPKVFLNQNLILADLYRSFPGLIFEANGDLIPPPSSGGNPDEAQTL
jgi:hypothetical protein